MTELATNGGEEARAVPPDDPVRVLVVDDEPALRTALARVLKQRGMQVSVAENGQVALEIASAESFDVVLTDVRMPELTGSQLLTRLKEMNCPAEVVMMTAFADLNLTVTTVKGGAYGFLTKPFVSNESVVIEVQNAAQFKRLRERTEHLQRELSARAPNEMIGASSKMREVYRLIDGVATTDSTVLVLGESGTGKELVARAIHERSRRSGRRLVTVNCAAIPQELVESELFGHTRGAFTTAVTARAGLFEAANGGTLFLDEIGDLPISAQVKLLRALQSGEIKPVGSDAIKTVDVRVIAATNVDLRAAIAGGTFRQDLFYRLNVIALELPALRERGDDTLLLAQHFVRKYAERGGRAVPPLSPEAAQCLLRYPWPGNVRELEHAIERAMILHQGETLAAASLPSEVRAAPAPEADPPESSRSLDRASLPDSETLARDTKSMDDLVAALELDALAYPEAKKRVLASFNESYVKALMKASGGSVSEAARRSGLDRSNFRRLARSTASRDDS